MANAKVMTNGKVFKNIKTISTRAVSFEIANKGDCVIGFAKDRNAFMEFFNGYIKEVTKSDVLKRLSVYQGSDVAKLVKLIKQTKPVTMAAGHCETCNKEVSTTVKNYSMNHFGKVLCRGHQPKEGRERSERQSPPEVQTSKPKYTYQEVTKECDRCGGSGKISAYRHVAGGVCFKCEGAGKVTRKERVEVDTDSSAPSESEAQYTPAPGDVVLKPTHVNSCVLCWLDGNEEEVQLYYSEVLNQSVCLACATEAAASMHRHGLEVQELDFSGSGADMVFAHTYEMDTEMEYLEDTEEEAFNKKFYEAVEAERNSVVQREPNVLLPIWRSKRGQWSSCHAELPCECGQPRSAIKWHKEKMGFGCSPCGMDITPYEYMTRSHAIYNSEEMQRVAISEGEQGMKKATRKKCITCGKRRKVYEDGACKECTQTKTHNAAAKEKSSTQRPVQDKPQQEQPQDKLVTATDVESML